MKKANLRFITTYGVKENEYSIQRESTLFIKASSFFMAEWRSFIALRKISKCMPGSELTLISIENKNFF